MLLNEEMSEIKLKSVRMAALSEERSATMCKCVSNNGSQRKHAIFRGKNYKAVLKYKRGTTVKVGNVDNNTKSPDLTGSPDQPASYLHTMYLMHKCIMC